MKIEKAILSCDDNKLYSDFWPLVSRVWKEKFNIEPVLLYFGKEKMSTEFGTVINIDIIKEIPISIQTLWIRYFYPSQEPETTWIISDIDMFPISKYYFVDKISNIEDNKYVHLNPCINTYNLIPSCYHVAKGSKFKEVLDLPDSWEESIHQVVNSGFGKSVDGNKYWFADEQYATNKILNYTNKNDLVFLQREYGQNGLRIDRPNWRYYEGLVSSGLYFDSHSIRPYEKYKKEIDKLVNLILK